MFCVIPLSPSTLLVCLVGLIYMLCNLVKQTILSCINVLKKNHRNCRFMKIKSSMMNLKMVKKRMFMFIRSLL